MFWLLAYLIVLAAMVVLLFGIRRRTLTAMDTPQARAEWNEWREAARRQADGSGPVQRRVPKSAEPPVLVLMRDHFLVCFVAVLVFGTLLFAVLMVMIRGAFSHHKHEQ